MGAHNWSWVEDQIWFGGGNGSWNNPYIIENITIDALGSGNCIEIVDSNKYFILRNCTFSGSGILDAGLKLDNVNNSKIIGNHIFFNNGIGIYLDSSNNNTIFNNEIEYNDLYGFLMEFSDFNIISNNNIRESQNEGMSLNFGNHNKVINNTVYGNGFHGISVVYCDYSIFSNNSVYWNRGNGMYSFRCPHSIFLNNSFSENTGCGVIMRGPVPVYNITFLHNKIIGNLKIGLYCEAVDSRFFNNIIEYNNEHGILFINCEDNEITENSVSYNLDDGMYLKYCNNNTIKGNQIKHNDQNGIEFYSDCDLNNATMNFINYNHLYGLYLRESDNNSIIENTLIGNQNCIYEIDCVDNIFIDNICEKPNQIFIEILNQEFSSEEFNVTFYVYNINNSGLIADSILMWWNDSDISSDVQSLGNGLYFVSLEPIMIAPGEDPILLNMTISASGYEDKYFETYIAIELPEIVKYLQVDIVEHTYSLEHFNFTFFVGDELGQGIEFAIFQLWWDGTDVSSAVQNLGNGLYFISLEPITVAPDEDPILLNMTISAFGYEDKYFESYVTIDPDTLQKGARKPSEEFPLILIVIVSVISVGVIAGVAGIYWLRKRGRKEI